MMKRLFSSILLIPAVMLGISTGSGIAQTINCSSGFNSSSGACGFSQYGGSGTNNFYSNNSGVLDGTADILVPVGAGHAGWGLIYQTPVNNQAFTAKFTFVPNGYNLAFVVENAYSPNNSVPIWPFLFNAGAGGESGFSQFADGILAAPNNLFALELDSYSPLTNTGSFSYSSAQIYQSLQWPVLPQGPQAGYLTAYPTNKISTSPVPLNSPASSPATTTGDTYSATVTYDGYTLTLNLFDQTAGGSCPGATCFSHTWTGVYIPALTGGTTAYVGFDAGTSGGQFAPTQALEIKTFTYTVNTPTGTPSYTAWNADSTYNDGTPSAASPVYSVAPGTYSSPQTVAISTSTSPHNYICYVLSSTTPTLYPHPDSSGGCSTGTLYTGPISISSTATLYAMAGSNNPAFGTGLEAPAGLGPPSTLVAGTYTIGGSGNSVAATPTFSPAGGSYTSTQTVTLSDASQKAIICYSTTGNPATNGSTGCTSGTLFASPIAVSASETLYAVAGGTGFTDSPVASSSYTIQAAPPTPVATTTALSAPTTHLINGQQASITATVTPASGAVPTGNVSFFAGGQLLGSAPLVNGQATLVSAVSTQPGTFQVTATYNGSSLSSKSTSAPLTFTVISASSIGLSSNATQVVEGSSISLTASVSSSFGGLAPTGPVSFYVGPTALGTQQLSGGNATYSAQINLPVGQYQLTAVYAGDNNDESSISNALTLTVTAPVAPQVSTNTALTITPATPAAGQSIQLSSLVTAASGSNPTGVVNFFLGQTQIGSAGLVSGAAKIAIIAPSTSGSYQLTAVYAGTTQDSSSSSAPVTITIAPSVVATSISLVSSAQQVIQGQSFALSATVASHGSSNATGVVNFFLGQTQLGTGTLSGGQASWTGSASFSPGIYQVNAVYSGDSLNGGSTSGPLTLTVTAAAVPQAATNTTLTVSPSAPAPGQTIQLSSLVTAARGSTPTGVVNFFLGQTQIGSANLLSGAATVSLSAPSTSGSYPLTAVYAGNSKDESSTSSPVTITVSAPAPTQFSTNTTLTVTPTTPAPGQTIQLSSLVTAARGSTPTGVVNFFLGQTQIGSANLLSGAATISLNAPSTSGSYPLTAVYAGNSKDESSTSSPVTITVSAPAPTQFSTNTTLTVTPSAPAPGQTIQLSSLVTAAGGSTPTGVVNFFLGQTQIGSANLLSGTATVSLNAPSTSGSYPLTAVYAGNSKDESSTSSPVTLTVSAPAPTQFSTNTTLTVSPTTPAPGQTIQISSLVTAASGSTPTGVVNFYLGQTQIGSANLLSGAATVSLNAPSTSGSYPFTAVYAGNSQDSASSSAAITITISPNVVPTNIVLAASTQQVIQGQPFALSATIAPSGSGNPTGMVNFFLGQTQLGSSAVTNGQASWTGQASFASGTYQLIAVYAGDPQDSSATSSPVPLIVMPDTSIQTFNTTTALTLGQQQITAGQNVNLSIQVAEQGGTSIPAGLVTVYLGQTQMGSSLLAGGLASLSMVAPAPGTYTLTATYAGEGQDLSSQSTAATLVVSVATASVPIAPSQPGNPTFTMGLSNNTVSFAQGQGGSLQVSLSAVQGYQGAIQLSCSGLPAGVTCNFSPSTVSLESSSADSVLSISSNTTTASSTAMVTDVSLAMLAPWDIVGLLGIVSPRPRRRRSRLGVMVALMLAVSAGLVSITGCGLHINNITQPYQVSVTAVGANQQSQAQIFTLNVTGPAATF